MNYTPWTEGYNSSFGFDPPMDKVVKVKKNKVLPLSTELSDMNGDPVTDADIISVPVAQILFEPGTADADDVSGEALPAGQGTDGNQFEFSGGKWRLNLKTKNFTAPGIYTIKMVSGNGCDYVIAPIVSATFVIE